MIQFAVGGKLKNMITGGDNSRNLTLVEEMSAGIGAGTISALVGSPLELIMIQQQRKGGSAGARISNILEKPQNIGRGFVGAAIREALWTCGYLSIPPVVRRSLMEQYPDFFWSQVQPLIQPALDCLERTMQGKQWVAQLYNQVFQVEHRTANLGPFPG